MQFLHYINPPSRSSSIDRIADQLLYRPSSYSSILPPSRVSYFYTFVTVVYLFDGSVSQVPFLSSRDSARNGSMPATTRYVQPVPWDTAPDPHVRRANLDIPRRIVRFSRSIKEELIFPLSPAAFKRPRYVSLSPHRIRCSTLTNFRRRWCLTTCP